MEGFNPWSIPRNSTQAAGPQAPQNSVEMAPDSGYPSIHDRYGQMPAAPTPTPAPQAPSNPWQMPAPAPGGM